MNYSTINATPSAYITKRKSRLKIYNGSNVYLNDGENFEFELHNPKQKSVLVKIKLNGDYISRSGIVLKPGQRVFLERFLDTNNKFEFSTYSVKNTPENKSAIDLNGNVEIEFYDQEEIRVYPHLSGGNWTNGWSSINTGDPYLGMTYTTSNLGNLTYTSNSNVSSFYSQTSFEGPNIRSNISSTPMRQLKAKKSIETGRVEKGETSKQTFSTSSDKFNSWVSNIVTYKILPTSTKNTTVEEIRQYCTECGTKTKRNYKFCPTCGNKL